MSSLYRRREYPFTLNSSSTSSYTTFRSSIHSFIVLSSNAFIKCMYICIRTWWSITCIHQKQQGQKKYLHVYWRNRHFAPHLASFYSTALSRGEVPSAWRQANVIPVLESVGYLASNYRPVSLTCICSKVLEHIVVSNMVKHLELPSWHLNGLPTWLQGQKKQAVRTN